jgi:hypothetical protein
MNPGQDFTGDHRDGALLSVILRNITRTLSAFSHVTILQYVTHCNTMTISWQGSSCRGRVTPMCQQGKENQK